MKGSKAYGLERPHNTHLTWIFATRAAASSNLKTSSRRKASLSNADFPADRKNTSGQNPLDRSRT